MDGFKILFANDENLNQTEYYSAPSKDFDFSGEKPEDVVLSMFRVAHPHSIIISCTPCNLAGCTT